MVQAIKAEFKMKKIFYILFIFGWIFLLLQKQVEVFVDNFFEQRSPSFSSAIKIYQKTSALPKISYTRVIRRSITGMKKVIVQDIQKQMLCSSKEPVTFLPNNSTTKKTFWHLFVGNDCKVPKQNFRVCTQYTLQTFDSNTTRFYGPFCSEYFKGG